MSMKVWQMFHFSMKVVEHSGQYIESVGFSRRDHAYSQQLKTLMIKINMMVL